jgi:chemotaxis methyl-accepting protein methylase
MTKRLALIERQVSKPMAILLDRLSERHFNSLAEIIESEIGIRLPPSKRVMLEGRLRKRVRALGLSSLDEYGTFIFDRGQLHSEMIHLIDCVTTNKTDFFREPEHFVLLTRAIVPRLLAERNKSNTRPLKFWSAACSNGAEPYTMAMVLQDLSPSARFRFSILGTDICTSVIEQARKAVYPEEMLEPVPTDMRKRYVLLAKNPNRREFRIVPELRHLVNYQRLNLISADYSLDRDVDVIFCRNILIYFDNETQAAVVRKLCGHLKPGGFLFLGHSESMAAGGQLSMKQIAPTVFRRAI